MEMQAALIGPLLLSEVHKRYKENRVKLFTCFAFCFCFKTLIDFIMRLIILCLIV